MPDLKEDYKDSCPWCQEMAKGMQNKEVINAIEYTMWLASHRDPLHKVQALKKRYGSGTFNTTTYNFDAKKAFETMLELLISIYYEQ